MKKTAQITTIAWMMTTMATRTIMTRVVSPEISSQKFPEIYSYFFRKFPEIFTENFTPVQILQMDVYSLTFSLSIGFYSTSVL